MFNFCETLPFPRCTGTTEDRTVKLGYKRSMGWLNKQSDQVPKVTSACSARQHQPGCFQSAGRRDSNFCTSFVEERYRTHEACINNWVCVSSWGREETAQGYTVIRSWLRKERQDCALYVYTHGAREEGKPENSFIADHACFPQLRFPASLFTTKEIK